MQHLLRLTAHAYCAYDPFPHARVQARERDREKENEMKVGRKCALTGIIYNQANITGTKIRTRMRMCTFLTKIRTATTSAAKAHWNWRRHPLRTTVKRSMSVSRQCQACCCGGCDCVCCCCCTCGWAKQQQWECIWDESQTSISQTTTVRVY